MSEPLDLDALGALKKYGQHLVGCLHPSCPDCRTHTMTPSKTPGYSYCTRCGRGSIPTSDEACDCGFAEALDAGDALLAELLETREKLAKAEQKAWLMECGKYGAQDYAAKLMDAEAEVRRLRDSHPKLGARQGYILAMALMQSKAWETADEETREAAAYFTQTIELNVTPVPDDQSGGEYCNHCGNPAFVCAAPSGERQAGLYMKHPDGGWCLVSDYLALSPLPQAKENEP